MKKSVPIKFVEKVLDFDREWDGASCVRRDLPPGAASWISDVSGNKYALLDMVCPCGCGRVHCLPVCQGEKVERAWLWDGNVEKPTLTPSIRSLTQCAWHGYLTAGVFVPC